MIPASLEDRLAGLSPEKRALVMRTLSRRTARIPRASRTGTIALSAAQRRIWLLYEIEGPSAAYNISAALRLTGALNRVALEQALNEIVRRHEALRTNIVPNSGGEAEQRIASSDTRQIHLPVEAVTGENDGLRRASEEGGKAFDLESDPLFRAHLFGVDPETHVLLLVVHHIVADGWSMSVISQELSALYSAFLQGALSPLPELSIQYADYAVWSRAAIDGPAVAAAIEHWRSSLDGAPQRIELLTDRPCSAKRTARGGAARFQVDSSVVERLGELAKQQGATPFPVALAALAVLLSRYSSQNDIVIGSPFANRGTPETESLVGFFINTLPLRLNLADDPSFREVVVRARRASSDAITHQGVSFERVLDEIRPEREHARMPLCQVILAFQNTPEAVLDLPGLTAAPLEINTETSKFELTFILEPQDAGWRGMIEYSADLFDRATVDRMVEHFRAILASVAANPDAPMSEIELLSARERRLVLERWSGVSNEPPSRQTVTERFAQMVSCDPTAVALILADRTMSYAELDWQSEHIAGWLEQRGIGVGRVVGLCSERSFDIVVAALGILKAGAAYLPLDPGYPIERLNFMIEDAGTSVVLTHAPAGALNASSETIAAAIAANVPRRSPLMPERDDLAYIMYTSGSTGQPKGVRVPHRAVVRLCVGPDFVSLDPGETLLQLAPISFDAATFEIWGALLNGARLVIAPPGGPSLADIGDLIRTHGVTTMWVTSGLFNLMVDERVEDLAGLRQILAGGDVLSPPHLARASKALKAGRIINGYGPTENTTFTCCHTIHPDRIGECSIPIGRPSRGPVAYILDSRLRPVPIGIPGELYAGGDGLAIDYLNRPALTAERFVPNSFGPGRLYGTGDLARWLPDGTISFLGRIDQQVKIRGFRVEPGEVEAFLKRNDRIRDAAVIVYEPVPGRRELAAYIVPVASDISLNDVQFELSETLPEFMLPSAIVTLDALPMTANGKLDRAKLPAPDRSAQSEYEAPRTATEVELAGIFCEVLSVQRAGACDNFFDLGGNSLLATQVVSRIRARLGITIPLRQIFATPDLQRLAKAIDGARQVEVADPIARCDRRAGLPLSFAQERLWFLQRLEPENPFYNIAFALKLEGELDANVLDRSLREIVRRHEVLRSTYHEFDGNVIQRVDESCAFAMERLDLRELPDRESQLEHLAREAARRPFDLTQGPVIRATLLALQERVHVLLLTLHHIAADGWSVGVLVREITVLYRGGNLPAPVVQYADFSAWQRRWMEGAVNARQCAYWKRQLAGYSAQLRLPSDRPRPAAQTFRGGSIRFEIDVATVRGLNAIASRNDATLFMALLAGFSAMLSRYSAQDDIIIGSPIANRTRVELEALVGFFVNTLPLRVNLAGDPTFLELLRRVRAMTLDAYANQDLPFERLVDEIQPERDLSRNPLFQVMLALQNAPNHAIDLPHLRVNSLDFERTTAQFDLVLDVWETAPSLLCVLEYSTDMFDRATVARMVEHFQIMLAGIAAAPETRVSDLPILAEPERITLLDRFNANRAAFPLDSTLHALFEERVDATPDRIAAQHGEADICYAALEQRANRIAHRLRQLAIAPNDFAVLLLDRGIDFLAAMLGVLKAGGAFVPVDPSYPPQRISDMIRRSDARVVITQRAVLDRIEGVVLPDTRLLLLHEDANLATQPVFRPAKLNKSADRAYMLYTSGSTGLPKGAIIRHEGKINHIYAQFRALRFHTDSVFLQTAPSSSDISVWQFLGPVLIGGRVVIADFETLCDPAALWNLIRSRGVTIIELVPVAMNALLEYAWSLPPEERALPRLEWALVTGEAASPSLVNWWLELFPAIPIANAYGPTEAADDVCQHVVTKPLDKDARTVPIGTPLANLTMYVLDPRLQLLPIGVTGEICISGVGVGEGYWRDEAQTRERFVPNPYASGGRGDVLYRTGDAGFWRPEGLLECVSRFDDQVKIRGFRIELPGIEAELAGCPAVRDAVVLARDDDGERRLIAYVVPNGADVEVAGELRRIRDDRLNLWEELNEDEYRATLDYGDPTFNVIGWDSSYGGTPEPISELGMHEYVDHTVSRVRALRPARLLEVGCGTGLILFRLLPHLQSYLGVDLSPRSIGRLQELQQRPDLRAGIPNLNRAVFKHARADKILALVEPGSIDTAIFPSVVQYFPGVDYLLSVIDQLSGVLDPNGSIFFGDVRSRPLLDLFHASVQLSRASGDIAGDELMRRVQEAHFKDQEMALDPAFFFALRRRHPNISDIEILPKRGADSNEMTRFRYDVAIRLGNAGRRCSEIEWQSWEAAGRPSADELFERLIRERPRRLGIASVANARVGMELQLREALNRSLRPATVRHLRERLSGLNLPGVEPEALWGLAGRNGFGYDVHLSFARSGRDGSFDLVFVPKGAAPPVFPEPEIIETPGRHANNPLHERWAQVLQPRVRDYLKTRLPQYMVPSALVILEQLPVGPSGKVDRSALPAPRLDGFKPGTFIDPRTEKERALAAIWREVLGVESCGLGEDFFERGGHSLKATQVVSRIKKRFGVDVPVRSIFTHRTIETLAALITDEVPATHGRISRCAHAPHYATSHAQRRIWVLSQIDEASLAYNMPASVLVEGPLDVARLELAFNNVVARHESLRTTFSVVDGEVRQFVQEALRPAVRRLDYSTALDPESAARDEAARDAALLFDLATGPLARLSIIELAPQRYVLLFNVHHIVCDDLSISVLVQEVMSSYDRGTALPPLGIQYRDFSHWQNELLESEAGRTHQAYWLERLKGDLPVLDVPTDYSRPKVKTYRGQTLSFRWTGDATKALAELAIRHESTLFLTLLAAVKTLLYRHTGQTDVMVAVPSAGRENLQLEGQIGFYVNTLALRDVIEPRASFTTLLAQVTRNATEAFTHESYPFNRLVDELGVRRDPSRNPLCDVVVVMQNGGATDLRLPGIAIKPFVAAYDASKYDLHFVFEEREGALCASIVYNPDLFRRDRIERMASQLRTLTRGIVADDGVSIDALPMLPPDEVEQLVTAGSIVERSRPSSRTLIQEFEECVAIAPNRVAVSIRDATGGRLALTYRELDAAANRSARILRARGVGPEVFVALFTQRSLETIVGVLAIMKAGGAYVPLDPAYPERRIEFILTDAGVRIVLTTPTLCSRLVNSRAEVVLLDSDAEDAPDATPSNVEPSNAAYMIYTSGSTGQPKGVVVTHDNAARLFASTGAWFQCGNDDVWTLFHSIAFDFSVWELWGPLRTGGRLVIVPQDVARSPQAFWRLLAEERVTVLNQTPSAFRALMDAEPEPGVSCTNLRYVIFGGEALDVPSLRPWFTRHGDKRPALINMYGITETTVHSSYRPIRLADLDNARSVIGCPIPDLSIRILGPGGSLAPLGIPGEICVGGAGVARGYWNRPELTAERFIPDPVNDGRLYRSGDLGRYLPDGDIEYLGRMDHQVKVRGFRVELGEIEAALASTETVRQALVVAEPHAAGHAIVAYVVADPEAVPAVRQKLRERLPDYMIPSMIVPLRTFPLTPHGKIDRAALATLQRAALSAAPTETRCQTEAETIVSTIVQDLLDVSQVPLRDNFFDLGAHSLLLVRVHTELQRRLGRKFPLVALYQHPTVEALAAYLTGRDGSAGSIIDDEAKHRALRRAARPRRGRPGSSRGANA